MANHRDNLLQLSYIRTVTFSGQCLAVLFAIYALNADLAAWSIGSALFTLAVLNLMTYIRLFSPWPVTEPEFCSQLIADTVLYAAILFHMGGATNPFVFLLLVPLIIASTTLSKAYIWLIATMVLVIYSSLLFYYTPLIQLTNSHQHRIMELFDIHIGGMWVNFILTVLVVTYFIERMRNSMQRQQQKLELEREKRIQDQQLLSLATMAAGTAHELGTPLSTIQVLLKELQHEYQHNPQLLEDLDLLEQQTQICADKLKQMAQTVKQEQASSRTISATQLIEETLEHFTIQRPEASFTYQSLVAGEAPLLNCTTTLRQSLLNLLHNAADAEPKNIAIKLEWNTTKVNLMIHDQGPGVSLEQSDSLGKPFVTTKGKGLGIGLFLTTTTLTRYAGDVRLYNHPEGGTLTDITLALDKPA